MPVQNYPVLDSIGNSFNLKNHSPMSLWNDLVKSDQLIAVFGSEKPTFLFLDGAISSIKPVRQVNSLSAWNTFIDEIRRELSKYRILNGILADHGFCVQSNLQWMSGE